MSVVAGDEALVAPRLGPEGIPFAALVTAPELGLAYEGAG